MSVKKALFFVFQILIQLLETVFFQALDVNVNGDIDEDTDI